MGRCGETGFQLISGRGRKKEERRKLWGRSTRFGEKKQGKGREGEYSPLPLGVFISIPTWEGTGVGRGRREGTGSPERCVPRHRAPPKGKCQSPQLLGPHPDFNHPFFLESSAAETLVFVGPAPPPSVFPMLWALGKATQIPDQGRLLYSAQPP